MNRLITILAAAMLILAARDSTAKEWQLLVSFPGTPASLFYSRHSGGVNFAQGHMDFDGDAVTDLSFLSVDPTNPNIVYVEIRSGADPNQKWNIQLSSLLLGGQGSDILLGYFNFDPGPENTKDILVAEKRGSRYVNPTALLGNGDGTFDYYTFTGLFVAVGDINNDNIPELIVADPGKKEVQVWGVQ